jgi:hypothetical protein
VGSPIGSGAGLATKPSKLLIRSTVAWFTGGGDPPLQLLPPPPPDGAGGADDGGADDGGVDDDGASDGVQHWMSCGPGQRLNAN